jgi:hypothetical protein
MRTRNVLRFFAIGLIATLGWPALAQAQAQKLKLTPLPPSLAHKAGPAAAALARPTTAGSPWQPLTNQMSFFNGAGNPLLLTDGSVLVQDAGFDDWWRLVPDENGSYVNGTWVPAGNLPPSQQFPGQPYRPLYHSSAVLPDGRVIIEGGEYQCSPTTCTPIWQHDGAIYDPIANVWASVPPPPFFDVIEVLGGAHPYFAQTIGDAQGIVLADGTYMQADCCTTQSALLDARTLTWTPTGSGKFDLFDEEGWTLLSSGKVLTVDAYVFSYDPTGMGSEIYDPRTGAWTPGGSTKVQLWDSAATCGGENNATQELGPAVLRPDGTVFYMGSNTCGTAPGHNAIYNSKSGQWRKGPDFPGLLNIADGPAALEPNGNVLMMASPGFGNAPSTFLEWDGQHLTAVPGPPNAPVDGSYFGNMLVLPTGQILLTDFSNDIEIYTPQPASDSLRKKIQPEVFFAPGRVRAGGSYLIFGVLFNGVSQGAAYGDDVQAATNYPVVRITNLRSGHVFYARTHHHSSMAVASDDLVWTTFDVSAVQESGPSKLEVVANGVASEPLFIKVE